MLFKFFLDPDAETGITTIEEPSWTEAQVIAGDVIRQEVFGGPHANAISRGVQAAASDFNSGDGTAKFTVVTYDRKDTNRHGNRVNIMANKYGQGLNDEDWKKNPVIFFDHGFADPLPIGTGTPLQKSQSKAVSTVKFHGKTPTSSSVMALVDDKVLQMASIGFDPRKGVRIETKPDKSDNGDPVKAELMMRQYGWEILEAELQEWSVVGIGADRGALRQAFERRQANGEKFDEPMMRWLQMNMALCQAYGIGWEPPATQAAPVQRVEIVVIHQNAPMVFPNVMLTGQSQAETSPKALGIDAQPLQAVGPLGDIQSKTMAQSIADAVNQSMMPLINAQAQNAKAIATVQKQMNDRLGIIQA